MSCWISFKSAVAVGGGEKEWDSELILLLLLLLLEDCEGEGKKEEGVDGESWGECEEGENLGEGTLGIFFFLGVVILLGGGLNRTIGGGLRGPVHIGGGGVLLRFLLGEGVASVDSD